MTKLEEIKKFVSLLDLTHRSEDIDSDLHKELLSTLNILYEEIEERDQEIKRLKKLAREDDDPFGVWLRSM